jgi:hypothetical protein
MSHDVTLKRQIDLGELGKNSNIKKIGRQKFTEEEMSHDMIQGLFSSGDLVLHTDEIDGPRELDYDGMGKQKIVFSSGPKPAFVPKVKELDYTVVNPPVFGKSKPIQDPALGETIPEVVETIKPEAATEKTWKDEEEVPVQRKRRI